MSAKTFPEVLTQMLRLFTLDDLSDDRLVVSLFESNAARS